MSTAATTIARPTHTPGTKRDGHYVRTDGCAISRGRQIYFTLKVNDSDNPNMGLVRTGIVRRLNPQGIGICYRKNPKAPVTMYAWSDIASIG